jgi:hypothetical protein
MKLQFAAGAAGALVLVSGAAQAAITVETTSFIASPTHFNGFEGFGPSADYDGTLYHQTSYTEDGISVAYVGSAPNQIWGGFTSSVGGEGDYGWYPNGGGTGYTRITLEAGGDIGAIQFLAGSGWGQDTNLAYQLQKNGVVVASGVLNNPYNMHYLGFSGVGFDEVDLQSGMFSSFSGSNYEAFALDSVAVGAAGPVPEPGIWALMIVGLGLTGAVLRRRTPVVA